MILRASCLYRLCSHGIDCRISDMEVLFLTLTVKNRIRLTGLPIKECVKTDGTTSPTLFYSNIYKGELDYANRASVKEAYQAYGLNTLVTSIQAILTHTSSTKWPTLNRSIVRAQFLRVHHENQDLVHSVLQDLCI